MLDRHACVLQLKSRYVKRFTKIKWHSSFSPSSMTTILYFQLFSSPRLFFVFLPGCSMMVHRLGPVATCGYMITQHAASHGQLVVYSSTHIYHTAYSARELMEKRTFAQNL